MALTRIRLGDYIERSTVNNHDLKYGIELIEGVNNTGVFTSPKGNPMDVDLAPYKIVNNGAFVYNPTRLDLGSIAYRTEGLCIVSHLYMIFYLTEEGKKIIDPIWLFIYFRRDEFQREVTFRNFGSQRPEFNFSDMSDILIPLPPIEIQKKYVEVYNSMLANQKSYERGLEDLKLTCDVYIEDLRRKHPCEEIGKYAFIVDERNSDEKITNIKGLTVYKKFIETKADMTDVSLKNYKIVRVNDIAYVPTTNRNGDKIACGLCTEECIISSIYEVMRTDVNHLLPEFLFMWFKRTEFDRWVRYNSWGSARETIEWNEISGFKIPIPSLEIQRAIIDIYSSYQMRIDLSEKLKSQIKDICPILIKGSIEEAKREA